jgi:hypothetical protein
MNEKDIQKLKKDTEEIVRSFNDNQIQSLSRALLKKQAEEKNKILDIYLRGEISKTQMEEKLNHPFMQWNPS